MKVYLCCLLLVASASFAQDKQEKEEKEEKKRLRTYEKKFQVSLFPGISTNGIASGFYFNKYSLNIFGGLSAGNDVLEIGLITNSHFQSSTGIQFAGFANISGTNAFVNLTLSEERALLHDNFEVNNQGIMIAGFLNYTLNHMKGIQFTGGFNHAGNDFRGVQIAGIGNSAGGYSSGIHIAGLYNLVQESVGGMQISTAFNFADGQLSGTQIALVNKARWMKGGNSTPVTKARSLQIGLINFSREMHGTQIGLINFGGEMRGKQIGLINFFQRFKSKELSNAGTPIGLLNLGSFGSVFHVSVNEMFIANIEYTTGNCRNCTWTPAGPVGMPYTEHFKKKNQNALILGFDPIYDTWAFGYGFMKLLTNKETSAPSSRNETYQLSYGVKFLHLNEVKSIDKDVNLVTRLSFDYGKRRGSKYFFVGVALNYFLQEKTEDTREYDIRSFKIDTGELFGLRAQAWPGYTAGIQF
jgi:hypothetical protein